MTTDELINLHVQLSNAARDLMRVKSRDYSGGGEDALANFKSSEQFGVHPVSGILTRMADKMKRVATFVRKGKLDVRDESVRDTLIDLINYPVLMAALIHEKCTEGNVPDALLPKEGGQGQATVHQTLQAAVESFLSDSCRLPD